LSSFKDLEMPRKDSLNIPEMLIKVMGQCELYRSRQYRVDIYQKTFKEVRK
jgi:hypothetical protein